MSDLESVMKPRIKVCPDFGRFEDVLLLKRAERRPPVFDFHIALEHLARSIGTSVEQVRDYGDAWAQAYRALGYDFVQCSFYAPMRELHEVQTQSRSTTGAASHTASTKVITSLEQFRSRRWSWQEVGEGNFSPMAEQFRRLEQVIAALPKGMKIMLHTADVFTFAWEMIGFDEYCLASLEEPEFLKEVMDSLEKAQFAAFREAIRIAGEHAGVAMYSDDIAYTEGLMLSPEHFRETLFPRIKRLVELSGNLPLVYHSDGRLYQVFDDLAAAGVRAIQPLEPKSMDPLVIKEKWPGKFCLCGNIDLDLMSRGTAEAVEKHVREKVERLNVGGGYMPGVSNTVPVYVNYENYVRMIETVYSYGG